VASLLASPISWSHHWVWAIPCLGTLAFRTRWWVFGLITAVVAVGPMQFMPKEQLRELHHTHPQQLVANIYALLAVAYLIYAWVRLRHAAQRPLHTPE
jgi:alpha-1,2-mannosyltransferase